MSARFAELDYRETPMGVISLRRRRDPRSGADIFEVKLDDDFLMSSLYTVAEVEVARLALARLPGDDLDVLVGGLGPRLHGARRARRSARALAGRGRSPGRGDRVARERADSGRRALDGGPAVLPGAGRLLRARGRTRALIRAIRSGGSTPWSSTSTTRRSITCTRVTPGSTRPTALRAPGGAPAARRLLLPLVERPAGCGVHRAAGRGLPRRGGRPGQLPQPSCRTGTRRTRCTSPRAGTTQG